MKKVLFATTALVATAGVAQADVALSGSAAMGMFGTGGTAAGTNSDFITDIDVTFTMSGTTDGGLTFGASIDLDESDGAGAVGASAAFAPATQGGETIFISGEFGTVTMGDTDGAFDWAMGEVPAGNGFATDAHEGLGWNGNGGLDGTYGGQVLRYDNTFGGFGVAVSAEIDGGTAVIGGDPVYGIGFKYTLDLGGTSLDIGLGHQTASVSATDDREITGISLGTTFSGVSVGVNFSSQERTAWALDQDHMGIGFAYSMDAWTFGLHHGVYENVAGVANTENSSTGVTVSYDLGGGASLRAGGSQSTSEAAGVSTDSEAWAFGLNMSF